MLDEDDGKTWSKAMYKSMKAVEKMLKKNGAIICKDLKEVADCLNSLVDE